MEQRLKYRMYGLVAYQLSPIQKGIQFGHAVVEYGNRLGDSKPYRDWAYNDKTFIILNGGTTNQAGYAAYSTEPMTGTLDDCLVQFRRNCIPLATFYEPDLNNTLTAICFLVDERVWDREKYPDFNPLYRQEAYYNDMFGDDADRILFLRSFLSNLKLAQ